MRQCTSGFFLVFFYGKNLLMFFYSSIGTFVATGATRLSQIKIVTGLQLSAVAAPRCMEGTV